MKFRGVYSYSIDNKGRVMLPNELREVINEKKIEKFILLNGFSNNYRYLFLLPSDYAYTIENKLESLRFFDNNAQKIFTFFFGNSFEVVPDNQGRVRIPLRMLEYNGINKEIIITGEGDFIKLWSSEDYSRMYEEEFSKDKDNLNEIIKYLNEKYDI